MVGEALTAAAVGLLVGLATTVWMGLAVAAIVVLLRVSRGDEVGAIDLAKFVRTRESADARALVRLEHGRRSSVRDP